VSVSDLKYFSSSQSNRLLVEVKDDAMGAWVDLNAQTAAGFPDYYAGLITRPTVNIAADQEEGIYSATISTMIMDNSPWTVSATNNKAGFWDQPFPVHIKRGSITYQFNSWQNRWVRLTLRTWNPDGTYYDFTLPPFIIDEHPTTRNGQATLKLASLFRLFQKRSAETLKVGTDWAKGWPIKSLVKMIAARTHKDILFASGSDSGKVDLGMDAVQRASSWGSAPGILTTGEQATQKWIPKCSCVNLSYPNQIWFGFACPGAHTYEDAAVSLFHLDTGQWDIPWTYTDVGGYPIAIAQDTTNGYVWMWCVSDCSPTAYQFYNLALVRITSSTTKDIVLSGASYWPGRETLRKGYKPASTIYAAGPDQTNGRNFGESIMAPFAQRLDDLLIDIFPGTARTPAGTGYEQEYVPASNIGDDSGGYLYPGDVQEYPATVQGGITALTNATGTFDAGAFRYFMGTQMHAPYRIVRGGVPYWFWIETLGLKFRLRRCTEAFPTVTAYHPLLTLLGSDALWANQITAWGAAPNSVTSDTADKVIMAGVKWDERTVAYKIWSESFVTCASFLATDGSSSNSSFSITLDSPDDNTTPDQARVCVGIFTPPGGTDPVSAQASTCQFSVLTLFNRANLQRPCYGIAVVVCNSGVAINKKPGAWYGDSGYKGPVSTMPFAGFSRAYTGSDGNYSATSFYFTDQATGQVWHCDIRDTGSTAPVWTLLNKGLQIHNSEFCHATINGCTTRIDDLYETVVWGLAPGPSRDIVTGYPLRDNVSSSSRHVPGIYPVVQLSRVIADAIEVADFSGMMAFDALKALRECAYDYRLYFTVDGSGNALLNFAKLSAATPECILSPLDMSPIPDALADVPYVGIESGWTRKLLGVKNSVDIVPYALTGAGEFTSATVKAAGSTWNGDYLLSLSSERPLRVAITCLFGGDVTAPEATDAANRRPILWTWERMKDTAHCWLAADTTAAATYVWVSGLNTKGGSTYAGDVLLAVGDYLSVAGGDQALITGFGSVGLSSGAIQVHLASAVGVDAKKYGDVTIEPHESRTSGVSNAGVTTLTAAFTIASGTTMAVASSAEVCVGSVIWAYGHAWEVTKIVSNTLTVSELFGYTTSPDVTIPAGTKLAVLVYTKKPGVLYQVGNTGVQFGVSIESDDVHARWVSSGDGVIVTATGMHLAECKSATIRGSNADSIARYGKCDVGPINNRFVDLLRGERLADKVLEEAWPKIELSGAKIPAIYPDIVSGSKVNVTDPRIVPTVAGAEQTVSFYTTGIRYNLTDCTSEVTERSATASTSGKRDEVEDAGSGMPAGRSGEE